MMDRQHSLDEQVFRDYKKWLLKMATIYLPTRWNEWHDLAQEGHIAMWKALRTYDPSKGALPSYLTQAARWRMRDCANRETWTGTMGARGHVREKPAVPESALGHPMMSADLSESASSFLIEKLDETWYAEIAEGVMLAYHRGEIGEVLSGFPDSVRSALYRKFWLDEVVPNGNWRSAVPVLVNRLEHLRAEYG